MGRDDKYGLNIEIILFYNYIITVKIILLNKLKEYESNKKNSRSMA